MGTLEELLLALLLQVGDVVILVSRLLTVSVSVRSSFLDVVVRNGNVQLTMPMSQYDK